MKCREALLGDHVTLLFKFRLTHFSGRTAAAGQFSWGGIHMITNHMGPKVGSARSEIGRRGQGQKPA